MAEPTVNKKEKPKKKAKPATKTYTVRVDAKIGSDKDGNVKLNLKRGQQIELTADKAENYKKHNIIL